MSGQTINLASQIPYAPWAKLNLQSYSWENVKASTDTKGYILGIESYLTPSLALEIKKIVEGKGAAFAFPSQSIYVEKK